MVSRGPVPGNPVRGFSSPWPSFSWKTACPRTPWPPCARALTGTPDYLEARMLLVELLTELGREDEVHESTDPRHQSPARLSRVLAGMGQEPSRRAARPFRFSDVGGLEPLRRHHQVDRRGLRRHRHLGRPSGGRAPAAALGYAQDLLPAARRRPAPRRQRGRAARIRFRVRLVPHQDHGRPAGLPGGRRRGVGNLPGAVAVNSFRRAPRGVERTDRRSGRRCGGISSLPNGRTRSAPMPKTVS